MKKVKKKVQTLIDAFKSGILSIDEISDKLNDLFDNFKLDLPDPVDIDLDSEGRIVVKYDFPKPSKEEEE